MFVSSVPLSVTFSLSSDVAVPMIKEVVLPTAPKADRATEIDTSRVPKVPPFKLYMGNIPYDCEEDMIREFFLPLEPIGVDLPKGDKGSKGFCYVEFADRETLISALGRDGTNFGTRAARISLPEDRRDRDGDRGRRDGAMGSGFDGRDPGRTDNDWRREPRALPPVKADEFPPRDSATGRGGFDRPAGSGFRNGFQPYQDRSQRMDAEPERDFENVRRQDPNFGPGTGRDSGSSWERNQGSRFVPAHDRPSYSNNDRYQERYQSDNRRQPDGHGREQQLFDSPREFVRPPREQQRREEEGGAGQESIRVREVPAERRKLQLQPRSKPKEEIAAPAETARSSIFGDAKPVDTTKKELEIEEKLKTVVPPDPEVPEDGSRIRRTSTGSGKSGQRSRQTSESGSHHSPREAAPPSGPRSGYTRQDSDRSQGEQRRPARILTNPDRDNRDRDNRDRDNRRHDNYGGHRDHYDRKDDRRDNYDRRPAARSGGYAPQYNRRDQDTSRYDNNGRGHYDGPSRHHQQHRDSRNQFDDHNNRNSDNRNSDKNDRRDRPRTERNDRPRNDLRSEKEPVSFRALCI